MTSQVNRIYESLTDGDEQLWLYVLSRGFSSSQGGLNAIAYGLTPGVREALFGAFVSSCPSCLGQQRRGSRGARVVETSSPPGGLHHHPHSRNNYGQGNTVAAAHASPVGPAFGNGRPVSLLNLGESTEGTEFDEGSAIALTVLSRAHMMGAPSMIPPTAVLVTNPIAVAAVTSTGVASPAGSALQS